jgi:lipoic acid synthetase
MVGLGEALDEVARTMADLRDHEVDLLTIGQYLQPDARHLPVVRFWHPDEYAELREIGARLGFAHVEAGPLVRSSYHAGAQARAAANSAHPVALEARSAPNLLRTEAVAIPFVLNPRNGEVAQDAPASIPAALPFFDA